MRRIALGMVLLAPFAATAHAAPVLDRVDSALAKNRALTVTVEATLAAPGLVTVTGDVNGTAVSLKKKMKAGHKTLKFLVDPKKLHLRALTTPLHFSLSAAATETGGTSTSQGVVKDALVPCILIPGLGNELTGGEVTMTAFATALDLAAGGRYAAGSVGSSLVIHPYASTTKSVAALGKDLDKEVKAALKGTPFSKVDLVGYSYGGVIARSYMSQLGGSRVRNCVFMAAPNEGVAIAYIGVGLSNNGSLPALLGSNAAYASAVTGLVNDQTKQALRNLFPTSQYQWLDSAGRAAATFVLGDGNNSVLSSLDSAAPPTGVHFDAFYYTSTPLGQLGTIDTLSTSTIMAAALNPSSIDPTTLATGSGDGLVPAHTVYMDDYPAWSAVIGKHDMGAGTHVTMPADPNVVAGVAAVVAP